jgi:hypothetical protein
MIEFKVMYNFAIVGMLAVFFVTPSWADDLPQPASPDGASAYYQAASGAGAAPASSQTVPAEKFGQSMSNQPVPPGSSDQPQAVQTNGISYITGGVGDEELHALEAVKNEYNLHVTNTDAAGEFDDGTTITILGRDGKELLNINAGPLFYAVLPVGTYVIEASSGGRSEKRKVTVGQEKPASIYFRW